MEPDQTRKVYPGAELTPFWEKTPDSEKDKIANPISGNNDPDPIEVNDH